MQTYTQLYSILNKDNKKILVNLNTWAELQLNQEELAQFMIDNQEIASQYEGLQKNGEFTVIDITKEINTATRSFTIVIGTKYIWANQRVPNEKYEFWNNKFATDPAVEYEPEILEG